MSDRTVHASIDGPNGRLEIARYDRAGKWYIEGAVGPRAAVSFPDAVEVAICWGRRGGSIHLGQPGGRRFDAVVRGHKGARQS